MHSTHANFVIFELRDRDIGYDHFSNTRIYTEHTGNVTTASGSKDMINKH